MTVCGDSNKRVPILMDAASFACIVVRRVEKALQGKAIPEWIHWESRDGTHTQCVMRLADLQSSAAYYVQWPGEIYLIRFMINIRAKQFFPATLP